MAILNDEVKEQVRQVFSNLQDEVRIILFKRESRFMNEIEEIVDTIKELSNKIIVEKVNFDSEEGKKVASMLKVDYAPAIVLGKAKDVKPNVIFYGIPAGYEFTSLIEAISMLSLSKTHLSNEGKEKIKGIDKEVEIDVFVTPSCPYCPIAVLLAFQFAMENKNIKSCMIEAIEFEELSKKYNVMAVPKIIVKVNGEDKVSFEGAYPEDAFISKVIEATK